MEQNSENEYWRRNLYVCLFGSFSTATAMTLMLPFLPIYVEQLGVTGHAAIVQWSGLLFAAAFFTATFSAPLWGRLADLYGRKPMLLRASFGMAIAVAFMGSVQNVWQLLALRALSGFLGGYSSGSVVLIATQTPKGRSGWALGMLSSGVMTGSLIGPLIGGVLPPLIGIRRTFYAAGAVIFLAFVLTIFLVRENHQPRRLQTKSRGGWAAVINKRPVIAMMVTGLLLMLANMSIEPIITVFVAQIVPDASRVTVVAGLAMSAAAFGSILSASRLGRLADRIGHGNVIAAGMLICALLLIPQAFVTQGWELVFLRFLMGLSLGGLAPCIATVIRHSVPEHVVGSMLGYSISMQYIGQVVGPLVGGFVGGQIGMPAVFLGTSVLMAIGAGYAWFSRTSE